MTTLPVLVQLELMAEDDSPCIGVCTLNKDGVCIGCERTLQEIHDAYLESVGMVPIKWRMMDYDKSD